MLKAVRKCVDDLGVKNAVVRDVLAEAESHGWERLVGSMSDENRAELVRMLAEDNQATHAVLEAVVGIYEQVFMMLAGMAEQELDEMAMRMADEVERALTCLQKRRGTNWLGLLSAGGIGYDLGKRA